MVSRYISTAFSSWLTSARAFSTMAWFWAGRTLMTMIVARMPMMTTTTMISIRVRPASSSAKACSS